MFLGLFSLSPKESTLGDKTYRYSPKAESIMIFLIIVFSKRCGRTISKFMAGRILATSFSVTFDLSRLSEPPLLINFARLS